MRGVAIKRLERHGTIRGAEIDANAVFRVRHRRISQVNLNFAEEKSAPPKSFVMKLRGLFHLSKFGLKYRATSLGPYGTCRTLRSSAESA